jgi:cellulose synthase operon protein C
VAGQVSAGQVSAGQVSAQTASHSGSPRLEAGLAALEQSQYAAAQRELEPLARTGPERGSALVGLARVQLATGHYEEASRTARLAGQADAIVQPDAAAVGAEALARLGKPTEAIALLEPFQTDAKARRARVLLGQLYLQAGRKAEANGPLMSVVDDYNQNRIGKDDAEGLALVGRAAQLLGSARDANDAYNEAERAGKHRVETLLWRAELFLDKYDPGHAEEVVREALQIAPDNAQAHVAMARVKLDQALDFRTAERELELALKTDPKIEGGFFVAAGLALRTMDLARADDALRRGLAANPGDLELLSLRAAMSFLADDRASFENTKKTVLGKNPS